MGELRKLVLRDGSAVELPLLVPSVSSKGFGVRSDGLSEASTHLEFLAEEAPEAILVSAYDLHHRLLPQVDRLFDNGAWETVYGSPRILIIDSGGFELGSTWDAGELYRGPHFPESFTDVDHERVLARLGLPPQIVAVTYDHDSGKSRAMDEQVAAAADLRERHPQFLVDALLKPGPESFFDVSAVGDVADGLRQIDIVGVTETELGDSVLDRAAALLRLRRTLDACGVTAPIHLFGVLDPVMTSLYFAVGAEIFDGLTWLRYAAWTEAAIYREATSVLLDRLDLNREVSAAVYQADYLALLRQQRRRLQDFSRTHDFSALGRHGDAIRLAVDRVHKAVEVSSGR